MADTLRPSQTSSKLAAETSTEKVGARAPGEPIVDRPLIRRMWQEYLKPFKGKLGAAVGLMMITAATTSGMIYMLDPAIEHLFIEREQGLLWIIPIAVIVLAIIKAASTYGHGVILVEIGQEVVARMQGQLFRSMVFADLARLINTHSGQFMATAVNNVNLVQRATAQTLTGLARDAVTILGLTAVMFYEDWRLTLVALSVIPFVVHNARKQSRKTKKATTKSLDETGFLTALISENLDGTRVVKAYGQEDREIERTDQSIHRRKRYQIKAQKARVAAAPVTEAITGVGIAGALVYGGSRGLSGDLQLNEFITFIAAMMATYDPLKRVSTLATTLSQGLTAAEQVFREIDTLPTIQDAPDAKILDLSDARIDFKNVVFHYDKETNNATALDQVSFSVASGSSVALVGPSGAGKSTVFNLIPRFYDVSAGSVEIDGQDVRTLTIKSLRDAISIVTQDPFLFDDTVYANIAYGRPDATEDDVRKAAQNSAALDFIDELPDGFDTIVGEGGARLSGGERQRIAIARAMLADTPILLLDEATSALDAHSEAQVQEALSRLMRDRTTIVIAHRLSTIVNADEIFVFNKGGIVESGTHEILMGTKGLYASLYAHSVEGEDA